MSHFNNAAGWVTVTLSKETLAQVFSFEFCKIFESTFLTEQDGCFYRYYLKYKMLEFFFLFSSFLNVYLFF